MEVISKRQQARNERELNDLLSLPGNAQCADCGARNPGWASWNLGIFVCMRCASLHRKLGTHISKVKSLSMDKWTAEQVDTMRKTGNNAANKIYNPKNRKPDIPLDADEVDSAMERYIRKKYQEKSLADGRPQPPQRDELPPVPYSRSPEDSPPPPPVPSKKGRFFGFGLRASSSAYPLSKHDKKKLPPEPRVDSAFTIDSNDFNSTSRRSNSGPRMSETDLNNKLAQLRDMGFTDNERNTNMLRRLNGNLELTVAGLVKFGKGPPARSFKPPRSEDTAPMAKSSEPVAKPSTTSNNPYDQPTSNSGFGLTIATAQPSQSVQPTTSNNPFDMPVRSQTDSGLDQSFQNLQVSQQPLFPHSTGGFPSQPPPIQDPRFQYSMTPPVQNLAHQYGYTASPTNMTSNPFYQTQQAPPLTDINPFGAPTQQPQNNQILSSNPFFNQQAPSPTGTFQQPPQQPSASLNPFGLPPGQSLPGQSQTYSQSIFDANNSFVPAQQTQAQPPSQAQFSNFHYGQPQQATVQIQQQQTFPQARASQNPYQSFIQTQPQYSQFNQAAATPLMPQQTGRYDKNSILALYNYPQLAPQQPLASIAEPAEDDQQQSQSQQQQLPSTDIFINQSMPTRRSATMPEPSTRSVSGGSRNPFFQQQQQNALQQQQQPILQSPPGGPGQIPVQSYPPQTATYAGLPQHSSRESVAINNLDSGRHSPDAFASLSARYMR